MVFSPVYPNMIHPRDDIFLAHRLTNLLRTAPVEVRIVAPGPWFPLEHSAFGRYTEYARIPTCEQHCGIRISCPRLRLVPKIGIQVSRIERSESRSAEKLNVEPHGPAAPRNTKRRRGSSAVRRRNDS
jgi:hypothetical protein